MYRLALNPYLGKILYFRVGAAGLYDVNEATYLAGARTCEIIL